MAYHPEPQDVCTITLFTKFCGCYLIQWSDDYTTLDFAYNINENWIDVRNKIFDVIVLLQYLEANYYIGVFPANLLAENKIYDHDKYNIEGEEWPDIVIFEKANNIKIKFKTEQLTDSLKKFEHSNIYTLKAVRINHEKTAVGVSIKKYANSTYHVTQGLVDFIDNDFQSKDDIKFKKNICISKIGIWTAIILGLISSILQIIQIVIEYK